MRLLFLAVFLIVNLLGAKHCNAQGPGTFQWTNGAPNNNPGLSGAKFAVDRNTYRWYEWVSGTNWVQCGDRIQQISGCAAPAYTPTIHNAYFVVNGCANPEFYYWNGAEWKLLNGGATYTAGTGIAISGGNVISADTSLLATQYDISQLGVTFPLLAPNSGTTPQYAFGDGSAGMRLNAFDLVLESGAATPTRSNNIYIKTSDASGIIGGIDLTGGASPVNAGGIVLRGGEGGVGGGTVQITGGNGGVSGGTLRLTGGYSEVGTGGDLVLLGGESTEGNGGGFFLAGGVTYNGSGGSFSASGGISSTGNGGTLSFLGGASETGDGGSVLFTGGSTSSGQGGNVDINAGESVEGAQGAIRITTFTGDGGTGSMTLTTGTGRELPVTFRSAGLQFSNLTTTQRDALAGVGQGRILWNSTTKYFNLHDGTSYYEVPKTVKASATLDFPSTAVHTNSDLTTTVTGAAVGDVVTVAPPLAAIIAHSCYTAWVSSANTVTVRFNHYGTGGATNPASGVFNIIVTKF